MTPDMNKRQNSGATLQAVIEDVIKHKHPTTVGELADFVKAERAVDEGDFSETVHTMVGEGALHLGKPRYDVETILDYLLIPTLSAWFWSTLGLTALAMITVFIAPNFFPLTIARLVFGSLLVLYLPGYSLVELLFPNQTSLTNLERFTLSVALSLCVTILIGLVINYLPGLGLRLEPIAASLSLFIMIFATSAMVRKFLVMGVI